MGKPLSGRELELLGRAHQLFAGEVPHARWHAGTSDSLSAVAGPIGRSAGPGVPVENQHYWRAVRSSREILLSAAQTDAAAAAVLAQARRDHAQAHELTKGVFEEARADIAAYPQTSVAQREEIRRRVARLRAQRAHVLSAYRRARQHRAALRLMRYRTGHRRGLGATAFSAFAPNSRARIAVRMALSRLGCAYLWGATGPDYFDCSGLVQWSYAQAGVHLGRTTYDQIYDGIPVPRSQVRPGDLVFPHSGHVQMAIGNNLVVEAPHAGATVRISPLGVNVQIRRPTG